VEGIFNVYKPAGITSYDVIRHIKKVIRNQLAASSSEENKSSFVKSKIENQKSKIKIGHGGTLDPFAQGVLMVLLGKATKSASQFLNCEKVYQGVICLGVETDTGDSMGKPTRRAEIDDSWSLTHLQETASSFQGDTEQTPPMYSALHYQGKRLYTLARANVEVPRMPRKVFIREFKILDFKPSRVSSRDTSLEAKDGLVASSPRVYFRATVSAGTYIRVLAQDFAIRLGSVGFCEELTRVAVGEYNIENSVKLEDMEQVLAGAPLIQ